MKKNKKILIVGGGLGGLATAICLSDKNFEITIIEKNSNLGGKINYFEKDGYKFDTGPSLITLPHIFENLFKKAGENIYEHLKLDKINPLFKYMFEENDNLIYSSDLSDLEKIFNENEINDLDNFYSFLEKSSRLFRLSEKTFFQKPLLSFPTLSGLNAFIDSPFYLFLQNYSKFIEKNFQNKKIRKIFHRYPTYVGSSPYKSSAILSIIPFMELTYGGWYIHGGIYKLIEAIEKILISKNIKIIKNTKVSSINHNNGNIKSVSLDSGEEISTDIVVSNVDPSITKTMVDKRAYVNEKSLSMSGLVLLVGINKKIPEIIHHNVIFSKNYKREFDDIFEKKQFPSEPTVYINCPSKTDDSLAPPNSESVFLMCNTPATKDIWGKIQIENAIHKIRKVLSKHKLEKIIDKADFIEPITPNDFEKKYASPYGSIYGKVSHGISGTIFRSSNKNNKLKGLYYVGGGVHPGGGTPTVIMSAEIVSKLIMADYE